MSQLIIGIAAVVLIVGLALAGTSYFGPRFMEAGAAKNSLIVLAAMRQTSDAIAIYRLKYRNSTPDSTRFIQRLITAGALKSAPANPFISAAPTSDTAAGAWPYPVYRVGAYANAILTSTQKRHTHIVMDLGASTQARNTCLDIQKRFDATSFNTAATITNLTWFDSRTFAQPRGGCFRMDGGIPGITQKNYVAYIQD